MNITPGSKVMRLRYKATKALFRWLFGGLFNERPLEVHLISE